MVARAGSAIVIVPAALALSRIDDPWVSGGCHPNLGCHPVKRMPSTSENNRPDRDEVLSSVLKAVREHRRLTVQQVADGMGMKKRSYERFEAGEGRLKLERIFGFATATDSDPYAIQASVKLGTPEFALACIDNKLCMLLVAHARQLFRAEGSGLATLQAQVIIEALTPAFAAMATELQRARDSAAKWLEARGPIGDDSKQN